jgi:crossover junction endodeoxyribonuclease RuvC
MKIVALDLSLTSTGWCVGELTAAVENQRLAAVGRVGTCRPPQGADRGMARLRWIRAAIYPLVTDADLVVLEGYAYARVNQAHQLGELGGVVRLMLFDREIRWVDVAPQCRAKFATGKGNATKELVLAEAVRKLGYPGSSTDEADALWLYKMAVGYYGNTATNAAQRAALEAVPWPPMAERTVAQIA